jgi:hypothetical protein
VFDRSLVPHQLKETKITLNKIFSYNRKYAIWEGQKVRKGISERKTRILPGRYIEICNFTEKVESVFLPNTQQDVLKSCSSG